MLNQALISTGRKVLLYTIVGSYQTYLAILILTFSRETRFLRNPRKEKKQRGRLVKESNEVLHADNEFLFSPPWTSVDWRRYLPAAAGWPACCAAARPSPPAAGLTRRPAEDRRPRRRTRTSVAADPRPSTPGTLDRKMRIKKPWIQNIFTVTDTFPPSHRSALVLSNSNVFYNVCIALLK